MPAKNIDKLFKPFFTTKEIGTGTGLSLAISHGIIESYNGKISIESQVGEGTCFTIALPKVHLYVLALQLIPLDCLYWQILFHRLCILRR
ncbi:hypothetical protein CW735_01955 [Alteromonas sp. MB-3u-76]|nr:hypothetical protein CW735_01955 [Alteromonas sp. MB-3u-76]